MLNQSTHVRRGILLLPPIILLALLFLFRTWNVAWGDGVSMCPIFDKFYRSTLTFGDLWEPYQGHRIVIHRAVELALGWATHWNINVEIGFIYLTLVVDFSFLCWLLGDLRPVIPARTWFLLAGIFSLSIFSTNQTEIWTNGFNLGIALNVASAVAGLTCLAKFGSGFPALLFAMAAGVVASNTYGNGLTYWGAAVPLLYIKLRDDSRWLAKSLLWTAVAGVTVFLYFHGLGGTGASMTLSQSVRHIFQVPRTFFTYWFGCAGAGVFFLNGAKAGLPASARSLVASGAPICGCLGLLAFAWTVWKLLRDRMRDLPLVAPWLSLGLYGVFSVGVTSIVRYTGAMESSISSRYIIYSQYMWLALFVLLAMLMPQVKRHWRWSMTVVLSVCYLISYTNGLRRSRITSAELKEVRADLLSQPNARTYHLINGDRDPAQVASFVEMTRRHRLTFFYDESVR